MLDALARLSPPMQALAGTIFTWAVTALGAAMVFFFKNIRQRILNAMLGFASGIMIAASFWSLLSPAISLAESEGKIAWLVVAIGFLAGGVFLKAIDWILPHVHSLSDTPEGIPTHWKRSILLVLSITLHNIPEGLAVGVAFGSVAADIPEATLAGAATLALGIGIQNFPEGAAVSVPLRREGMGRGKAFMYGQLSGIVEPIAGVIGALLVISMRSLLPYALAFAAGAMIYVVAEELIPTSQEDKGHSDLATIGVMIGFALMMVLDVALG
jgi:ZIP family zinc transporter